MSEIHSILARSQRSHIHSSNAEPVVSCELHHGRRLHPANRADTDASGDLHTAADRAFSAFMSYLQGLSDLTTTEQTVTAPVERHYLEDDNLDEVETELKALWMTLNDIVWQIPHDHPWQDKLALLLSALAERPPPPGPKRPIWGVYLWTDLPLYGPGMREGWDSPASVVRERGYSSTQDMAIDLPNRYKHRAILRQDHTRLNAFLARVSHVAGNDPDAYAIWAMRDALEEPLHPAELHLNVPGAAVWIYYAGHRIFKAQKVWEPGSLEGDPAVGGALWDGIRGFSGERWDLWREIFQSIAEYVEVQQETREFASKAASEMKRIESGERVKDFRAVVA